MLVQFRISIIFLQNVFRLQNKQWELQYWNDTIKIMILIITQDEQDRTDHSWFTPLKVKTSSKFLFPLASSLLSCQIIRKLCYLFNVNYNINVYFPLTFTQLRVILSFITFTYRIMKKLIFMQYHLDIEPKITE